VLVSFEGWQCRLWWGDWLSEQASTCVGASDSVNKVLWSFGLWIPSVSVCSEGTECLRNWTGLSSAQRVVMSSTICVQKSNPRSFTKPLSGWRCVLLSDYFVCDEIQLLLQSSFQNTKTFRTGMSCPVNEQVVCEIRHSCWTRTPQDTVSDKTYPVISKVLLQL